MNEDAAHDCLSELGNLGVIQFTDVSHFGGVEAWLYCKWTPPAAING